MALLRNLAAWTLVAVLAWGAASASDLPDGTTFIDAEKALRCCFGPRLSRVPQSVLSAAIVRLAESLPPGGAIDLPRSVPCGELDFRRVADDVQITGGHGGRIILGGGQKGIQLLFVGLDTAIERGIREAPLLNVDTASGKVLKELDLSPLTR